MGLTRPSQRIGVGELLLLGFGTLIVILGVVVGVATWQESEVRAADHTLRQSEAIAFALDDARFDVTFANLLLERYVVTGDANVVPELRETVRDAVIGIDEVLSFERAQVSDPGSESDVAELTAIGARTSGFVAMVDQIIALRQSSGRNEARAALEAAEPGIEQLEAALADATADEHDEIPILRSRLDSTETTAFWLILGLGSVGALIGLAATFVITRAIVRPLSSLESAALAVADGDLSARARPRGPRELARLGVSINRMADVLTKDREAITYLAYHDALTDLPNRMLLEDRAGIALAQASRSGQTIAIVSLDIDRLKVVNDTLGHPAGDKLLKAAALRLAGLIRDGDTLARMGGDEFVTLLTNCQTASDGVNATARMVEAFRKPFKIDGQDVHATLSAGICFFPEDGGDLASLIQNADAAMYRAKRNRNNHQVYDSAIDTGASERLELERALHDAVERDQLIVHYQPQVSLETGDIVGVEALVRWQHPERGLIPPGEFISLAEETGIIVQLGDWVLLDACQQAQNWKLQGLPSIRLAVNVSILQFERPDFAHRVVRTLEQTGFDPRLLELEVTESTIMQNPEVTKSVLDQLSAMGIRIAIDDFGTGYSSLQHLHTFPIHRLKIDRSFVRDLPGEAKDAAIAISVINLAHSLDITVVAEGVETQRQLDFLREHGCDEYQGFLHSRPLPPDQIFALLKDGSYRGTPRTAEETKV